MGHNLPDAREVSGKGSTSGESAGRNLKSGAWWESYLHMSRGGGGRISVTKKKLRRLASGTLFGNMSFGGGKKEDGPLHAQEEEKM